MQRRVERKLVESHRGYGVILLHDLRGLSVLSENTEVLKHLGYLKTIPHKYKVS